MTPHERLARRLRDHEGRVATLRWEYRQRHRSKGVWHRLRRVLADAERAYAVSRPDLEAVLAEGYRPEAVGDELAPPKVIVFLPAERVAAMTSARPLALRLDAALLSAERVVVVPFDAVRERRLGGAPAQTQARGGGG